MDAVVATRNEPGWWGRCVRWWSRAYFRFKRPFLLHRVRCVVIEHVDGVPLVVLPGVLNPVVFRGGEFLARTVTQWPAPAVELDAAPATALDMGTGCGVGAVFAARRGYRVVALDINPAAVRCARINVLLHNLEPQVDIRQGDLFEAVPGEQFDLVLFNPPFFVGQPRDTADMAWRSVDVMERFAAGLPRALKPTGRALVLLSTDGAPQRMLSALQTQPLEVEVVARKNLGNEIMSVYSVRQRAEERLGGSG